MVSLNLGLNKIWTISFGTVILLLQLFLFINTPVIFTENTAYWNRIMLTYLVLFGVFFSVSLVKSSLFKINFWQSLPKYLISFVAVYMLLKLFGGFFTNATFAASVAGLSGFALYIVIVHCLIISVIEEAIFRGALLPIMGVFFSSVVFALFHFAVYGNNIGYMALMFALGIVFALIKQIFSPSDDIVNSAAHGAYNISVYGI